MRPTRTWTLAREVAIGLGILIVAAGIGVLISFVAELFRAALSS